MAKRPSTRSIEIQVGIFVVGALLILMFASLWIIGSLPLGRGRNSYDVAMTSSGGVRQGDRVRVSGVEVGRIDAVLLQPGEEWPVLFRVTLQPDLQVTTQAAARISSEGLLGANYLEIDVGPAGAPLLPAGSVIHGSGASGLDGALAGLDGLTGRAVALLDQVSGLLEDLTGRVDPLLERATLLLSDENLAAFSGTLSGMDQLVAETRPALASLLGRLDTLAAQLEESTAGMPELSEEIGLLVTDLRAGLGPEGERLAALLDAAEESASAAGETFGMLTDNRETLDAALSDLQVTMANLKAFSQTLRERPSALIRNYRQPDRRPGDGVRRNGE